jgi:hypothetical protein
MSARPGSCRGQASVELIGAMLLVAALFGSLLAAAGPAGLASKLVATISGRLLCAVKASDGCRPPTGALQAAYGTDLAALAQLHAPEIRFEDGDFVSLPVDPRACRERRCADSSEPGRLGRSFDDYPATAFVHLIDCRRPAEPAAADCSGPRRRNVYIQYWLYYPESATRPLAGRGFHADDWESFQARVGPRRRVSVRASSHHGYNHGADPISDLGRVGIGPIAIDARRPAWGPSSGYLWVSAGSHAGRVVGGSYTRSVPRGQLRLLPIESELRSLSELEYAVVPPWQKAVWRDPEQLGS